MPTLPTNAGSVGIFISESKVLWMYPEYNSPILKLIRKQLHCRWGVPFVMLYLKRMMKSAILKERMSWRNKLMDMFTKILAQNNATFRNAIDIIISLAKDAYRSIFCRKDSKTIKSVMEAFGKDKEDYRAIVTFLVFTADKKENLSNSEYREAAREVDDVAIGRFEQAQKRGTR